MSIPVELADLPDAVAHQAPFAYLLTVTDDGRAHAVATTPAFDGGVVSCDAGMRTCANARARHGVTLLWPPARPDDFSLIVDGIATVDGPCVRIVPRRAVRHRPAPPGG